MKKRNFAILSFALLCLFAIAGHGQAKTDTFDGPVIEVTGKAEIAVEPDYAIISVDFTKLDKDLAAARRANEEGITKMLKIAQKYAIPPQDVKTNNVSVTMKYISIRDPQKRIYDEDDDEIGTRVFQGYEVSRSVTIKLTKLEQFDMIFNEILETQPTEIDKVSFETSRIVELREKAREMAMKAAHDKAKAMTAAIGQTVGKAIHIKEGISSDRYSMGGAGKANTFVADGVGTRNITSNLATFSAGSIEITSSVTVVFQLN